ncbi:AAA family ATPase [Arhodomonas aquaeolei]|uniref:AAA family ATPase n=1 Tax=Arhodomonas aquaeolei TaxID=2369 RepID=UPI00146A24D6|nr:AAA family ATPase [Arhodomonas aquaeolei]
MPEERKNNAMTGLSLRLLGPMEVRVADTVVTGLEGTKAGALLAYLAMAGDEAVPRGRLAALFWPDLGDTAARNNLRQTLYQLRRRLAVPALGDAHVLHLGRDAVRIDSDTALQVDALALHPPPSCCGVTPRSHACRAALGAMQAAVTGYRGPFLAGFSAEALPAPVLDWLVGWREAARETAAATLDRLVACLTGAGAPERAAEPVRAYLAAEPLDERAHRLLMGILLRAERFDEAIAQYDHLAGLLRRELDVDPAAETVALCERARARREQHRLAAEDAPENTLERRPVTAVGVHFRPGGDGDPEARAAHVAAASRAVKAIAGHYGGLAVHTHGGRMMIYFGVPAAKDATTLQAVRAAWRVAGESFEGGGVRVAVDARQLITDASPELPDPCGELSDAVLDLASRAPEGGCLVTDDVRTRIEPYFDLSVVESAPDASGLHRLVRDRQLMDRVSVDRWFGRLSPLVGREEELEALRGAWSSACEGGGGSVAVEAEPGLGKTRLAGALAGEVHAGGGVVLWLRSHPETRRQPLAPVTAALRGQLAAHAEGEPEPDWREEMRAFLAESPGLYADSEAAPAGAAGVASATRRRDRLIGRFMAVIRGIAARTPVLVVLEDLHWSDATTVILIRRLRREFAQGRVMLLITARPGTVYPWRQEDPVARVELGHLSPAAGERLIESLAPPQMPGGVRRRIRQLGNGVPLFIEELVRHYVATGEDGAVPATLQDLLAARLEALGPARGLARLAATLGRVFEREVLAAVSTLDGDELDDGLLHLSECGLIEPDVDEVAGRHRFRHPLIREAVYASQPDGERRAAHAAIAEVLAERFPGVGETDPGVMAHHLAESGQAGASLPWRIDAGYRMLARAAHREAEDHFNDALAVAEALPEGEERRDRLVNILLGLGLARLAREGNGSRDVHAILQRARGLHGSGSDPRRHFLVLWAEWQTSGSQSGFSEAQYLAGEMLRLADACDDRCMRIAGYNALISGHFSLGELETALECIEHIRALYRDEDHPRLMEMLGDNPAFSGLSFGPVILWHLGEPDRGLALADEMVGLAERADHLPGQAYALTARALLAQCRDDPEAVQADAERILAIANAQEYALWQRAGWALSGWVQARTGDAAGIDLIERTAGEIRQVAYSVSTTVYRLLLDALRRCDRLERAGEVLEQALADVEYLGNVRFLPELYAQRAEIAYRRDGDRHALAEDLALSEATAETQGAIMAVLAVHVRRVELDLPVVPGTDPRAGLAAVLERVPGRGDYGLLHRAEALAQGVEPARGYGAGR